MDTLTSLAAVEQLLAGPGLRALFVSQPDCSICRVLLPKVQAVVDAVPGVSLAYVDAAEVPDVAGRFNILTAPVVLVFGDGRELLREGRFVRIEEFEAALRRFAELLA
jgi:thiol-disulfide isomerase/thioredoxin